jgi:uncharacterized membrane protein
MAHAYTHIVLGVSPLKNFTLGSGAAAASLLMASVAAAAAPSFTCRPLADAAGSPEESSAWVNGLNNHNEAIGFGFGSVAGAESSGAMQWGRDRVGHRLPESAVLLDVNDAGEIVGSAGDAGSEGRPVAWKGGQLIELGALGGGTPRGYASAINKNGVIVGRSIVTLPSGRDVGRATMWRNGKIISLGGLAKKDDSVAYDVNDAGVAVGMNESFETAEFKAVRWKNGTVTELPPPAGGQSSSVTAINAFEVSVGDTYYRNEGSRATAWRGLEPVDLGRFNGNVSNSAMAINARGAVIGNSMGSRAPRYTPIYWASLDASPVDLNTLIPAGCTDAFGNARTVEYATAINDKGVIVAVAYEYREDGRSTFAFRLTPR